MSPDEKSHPRQTAILRGMTPAAKWALALQLQEQARWLKAQRLRSIHPDWDEARVAAEVSRIFLYART